MYMYLDHGGGGGGRWCSDILVTLVFLSAVNYDLVRADHCRHVRRRDNCFVTNEKMDSS